MKIKLTQPVTTLHNIYGKVVFQFINGELLETQYELITDEFLNVFKSRPDVFIVENEKLTKKVEVDETKDEKETVVEEKIVEKEVVTEKEEKVAEEKPLEKEANKKPNKKNG